MPTTILRPYLLSFRNRLQGKGSEGNRQRDTLLAVITLLVMGCIFIGAVQILTSMGDDPIFAAIIPTKIIELLFYVFFFLLLFSNTVSIIGNVYTAQNMSLFLTLPLSPQQLYLAKVIETIVETCLMFIVFLVPVLLAYYWALEPRSGFFLVAIGLAIPFVMIPIGVSMLLATVFVKFASVVWKRGGFFVLCLIVVLAWGTQELATLISSVEKEKGSANAIIQLIGLFDNPNPIWLPSRWIADILSGFIGGPLEDVWLKVGLLFAAAAASLTLGYIVFDLFHLRVRSAANTNHMPRDRERGDLIRRGLESIYFRLPIDQQHRAIILKDLSSLVRDRAQALQMLMYLGIALTYIVLFRFLSSVWEMAPLAKLVWIAFLSSINILFTGFILTAVMTRLVYPSVSLEGKSLWILLVTPVKIRDILNSKFWCWLPLSIVISISIILAGMLAIGWNWITGFIAVVIGGSIAVGSTGLSVGLGSIFATFKWESPNQIAVGLGTLVLLLTNLSLVVISFVPSSVLIFLTIVPELWVKYGEGLCWSLFFSSLALLISLNIWVARFSCRKGALALAKQVQS